MVSRKTFVQSIALCTSALVWNPATAFSVNNPAVTASTSASSAMPQQQQQQQQPTASIAYRSLSIPMGAQFGGATVPVACWYPSTVAAAGSSTTTSSITDMTNTQHQHVSYPHRISVRRIGQMLAGWDFIPEFVARDFPLSPTTSVVVNGNGNGNDSDSQPLPAKAPVVFLAHGYLGSRFDLSHLAEALAAEGFVCFSPEFPESLAASYDRCEGLDRAVITNRLLETVKSEWKLEASSYGIVGHSLGCGTAIRTGDETWTRVCISGNPGSAADIPGKVLFVSSMNDGVVSLRKRGGLGAIPSGYVILAEGELPHLASSSGLPKRAALVFDRIDAPNHISFLAEGVNDAMVDFLSPLLPVAQALSIPVLDFDRYKESRDSVATAEVVKPLVVSYLKQHMKMT